MDRRRTLLFAFFLALGLLGQPTLRADGDHDDDDDDQGGNTKVLVVKVQGPIDAIDLSATPPTITVLGLEIDISGAGTSSRDCGCDGGGSGGDSTVVFLTVDQNVEVILKNSKSPFVATKVTPKSGYDEKVAISAPIEAVDATASCGGATRTSSPSTLLASTRRIRRFCSPTSIANTSGSHRISPGPCCNLTATSRRCGSSINGCEASRRMRWGDSSRRLRFDDLSNFGRVRAH